MDGSICKAVIAALRLNQSYEQAVPTDGYLCNVSIQLSARTFQSSLPTITIDNPPLLRQIVGKARASLASWQAGKLARGALGLLQ